MEKEIFVDVTGYEGFYKVSNKGEVLSVRKNKKLNGCVCKGYKYVLFSINRVTKYFAIHRLVAMAFIENVEGFPIVDHIDGNKTNNNAYNLRWCTNEQNLRFDNVKQRDGGYGKSKYKGVYWHNKKNKWVVTFYHKGKRHHLGYFKDPFLASEAYKDGKIKLRLKSNQIIKHG